MYLILNLSDWIFSAKAIFLSRNVSQFTLFAFRRFNPNLYADGKVIFSSLWVVLLQLVWRICSVMRLTSPCSGNLPVYILRFAWVCWGPSTVEKLVKNGTRRSLRFTRFVFVTITFLRDTCGSMRSCCCINRFCCLSKAWCLLRILVLTSLVTRVLKEPTKEMWVASCVNLRKEALCIILCLQQMATRNVWLLIGTVKMC